MPISIREINVKEKETEKHLESPLELTPSGETKIEIKRGGGESYLSCPTAL